MIPTQDPRGRPAKFTEETRAEIKARWAAKPTHKTLATEYGCTPNMICVIVSGRNERRRKQKVKGRVE